jgi:hypothetical protein
MVSPDSIQPLPQALAPWHSFYTLLGAASATMTGLLFVAASVALGIFSQDRRGPLRLFLSASVVQFSSILVGCLIVLAPVQDWELLGGLILTCGMFGVAYSATAWRDTVRDGLGAKIDLEDRFWYASSPTGPRGHRDVDFAERGREFSWSLYIAKRQQHGRAPWCWQSG